MNEHRRRAASTPLEAYSRVTNPDRFASLHQAGAEWLDRLERKFEVERKEGYGLDPELEKGSILSRPSVALLPRDTSAAPLVIAFSDFPGLLARFGRWYRTAFPVCGCDACDETAEGEIERLTSLIDNITAGRFRETIQVRADGTAWKVTEFWSGSRRWAEELALAPARTQELIGAEDQSSYQWGPWPK